LLLDDQILQRKNCLSRLQIKYAMAIVYIPDPGCDTQRGWTARQALSHGQPNFEPARAKNA
jgi:hypothetical protein